MYYGEISVLKRNVVIEIVVSKVGDIFFDEICSFVKRKVLIFRRRVFGNMVMVGYRIMFYFIWVVLFKSFSLNIMNNVGVKGNMMFERSKVLCF